MFCIDLDCGSRHESHGQKLDQEIQEQVVERRRKLPKNWLSFLGCVRESEQLDLPKILAVASSMGALLASKTLWRSNMFMAFNDIFSTQGQYGTS